MDKTVIGLIAAIGAMAPLSGAQASAPEAELSGVMQASSFADLLKPIPNAVAILKAADQQETVPPASENVQVAQFVVVAPHRHHHHYHHHHHHHHHYYNDHHHHYNNNHHHHHHHYYNY